MVPNYAQSASKMMTTGLCITQNKGTGDLDKGSSEGPMG